MGLNGDLVLRTDPEQCIKLVGQSIATRRAPAKTLLEESPVNSPNSKAGVEGYIATLGGNVRALKMCVEERWLQQIHNGSSTYPWMVRHASWLHLRFQPQLKEQNDSEATTGYQRLRGQQ